MMRILYECRGITLADTGEGYAILKRGQMYIDSIEAPREAVIFHRDPADGDAPAGGAV